MVQGGILEVDSILFLALGGDYMEGPLCDNILNHTFMICAFSIHVLHSPKSQETCFLINKK